MEPPAKKPQGLASLSAEQRRAIASKGGKAVQRQKKGHRWTPEEASAAGKKGGQISKRRKPQSE